MTRRFIALGILTAVVSWSAVTQGADTISIEPATVSVRVAAGEVTLQTVYFTNRSGDTKAFSVERSDYRPDASSRNAFEFLPAGSTDDSIHPMLDVTPLRFELGSGKTQELLVRIRPATTASNGNYKGALFVGEDPGASVDASLQVLGRVGTMIGVTVTDGRPPAGVHPFTGQPNALAVAAIAILALFFLGVGLAAARKARQLEADRIS